MPRAFEPYHEFCMRCGCILSFELILLFTYLTVLPCFLDGILPFQTTCGPSGNPQTMGLQSQFCGGDLMNQQSQAQSQAQTQAQLAALREQNTILNHTRSQAHLINNSRHRLNLISNTSNNFFHSTNPRSIHIQLSPHQQCLNHQHRLHLNPHHRDPVYPSMLKR